MSTLSPNQSSFEVRFEYLSNPGRALSFPCDATGAVDMDALSERARDNYFLARTCVGRDFAHPCVLRTSH